MTQRKLQALTVTWQRRLRMDRWQITTVIGGVADYDGNNAQVRTYKHYDRAVIDWDPEYLKTASEEEINRTCVHELLHCLFRDFEAATLATGPVLGQDARQIYEQRVDHELEQLIDMLAISFVTCYTS